MVPSKNGSRRLLPYSLLFGSLVLVACNAPSIPFSPRDKALYTIEAADANYPVMLSRVPGYVPGRLVSVSSGTSMSVVSLHFHKINIESFDSDRSDVPASVQLARAVKPGDRWIQFERAAFGAVDRSGYGSFGNAKQLAVEATVQP